jgi:hypothetical protein
LVKKKKRKYTTLDEEDFYRSGEGRGIIRVSEIQEENVKTVSFLREARTGEDSWVPRKGKHFFSVSFRHIGKIIDILIRFARKFGWKTPALEKPEEQIRELKRQLDDAVRQKNELQQTSRSLEDEIENYRRNLENLRRQVGRNNMVIFKHDIDDFESLLSEVEKKSKKEEDVQAFLRERRWFFGAEYNNVEPKKPVGSKSIFDFYLEDYKGQGTVIELKLPSDLIFTEKEPFGLSPRLGVSLGQLIRYIETTISYSHSKEVSRIEQIDETRPLGYLIIGRTKSEDEIKKLKAVNYYLHSIQVLSYDMILLKARTFIRWLS